MECRAERDIEAEALRAINWWKDSNREHELIGRRSRKHWKKDLKRYCAVEKLRASGLKITYSVDQLEDEFHKSGSAILKSHTTVSKLVDEYRLFNEVISAHGKYNSLGE